MAENGDVIIIITIISLIEQAYKMQSYNTMKYELVNVFEEHILFI